MPLSTTQVIPPDWEAHHIPTVEGAMTAWVRMLRPDRLGSREPGDDRTRYAEPVCYWEGAARVQMRPDGYEHVHELGQKLITHGRYLIAVPSTSPENLVEDLCHVVRCSTATLRGRRLALVEIGEGSLVWDRYLGADLQMRTNRPGA